MAETVPAAGAAEQRWMGRALELAARGRGNVSPNPMVGAVLIRDGRVVGEGWHRVFGGEHAEIAALKAAGRAARGAVLYTNLEPCAHHGKTPPCVDALVAAGVARVSAALRDPDRRARGRGLRRLRAAGVPAATGLMATAAADLNSGYLKSVTAGRPLVILKAGMTLDGRIAGSAGRSRWITSTAARRQAHGLRAAADAVLVGAGTVRADDPLLTARYAAPRRRQPLRVVLDSRLSLPRNARLLRSAAAGPVIIYGLRSAVGRRRSLERAGAEVVLVAGRGGHPTPEAVLDDLGARGVASLMLEGGGEVAWSFLVAGCVDRLAWFVAPKLLGGGAVPVLGGPGESGPERAIRLQRLRITPVGPDYLVEARPRRRPQRR